MTTSQYYQYSFISLICLGLLIHNYLNVRQYGPRTNSGKFFRIFICSIILASVLEIVYGLREAGLIGGGDAFGYTTEILYSIVNIYAAYFWYIASELKQESKTVATKKMWYIVSIPLLIMLVVTVLTPIHHLNFYFENGHYVRGPLVLVFTLVMSVFILKTSISALVKSFNKKYYMQKGYFRIIFMYAIVLLGFQVLQLVFGSVMPFRTIGAMLVIYIVQQRYIKSNIYTDSLAGSNNRNAAERYLHDNIENGQENLQVAMIDIDNFKSINDTYGHQKGDKAIQLLAKAFMTNLPDGTFFARYGGDEFLLIDTSENTEKIEKIVQNARASLKELCTEENIGFDFDFSCGIIQKTAEMETIPDVIEAADVAMYQIKNGKKA